MRRQQVPPRALHTRVEHPASKLRWGRHRADRGGSPPGAVSASRGRGGGGQYGQARTRAGALLRARNRVLHHLFVRGAHVAALARRKADKAPVRGHAALVQQARSGEHLGLLLAVGHCSQQAQLVHAPACQPTACILPLGVLPVAPRCHALEESPPWKSEWLQGLCRCVVISEPALNQMLPNLLVLAHAPPEPACLAQPE
mmetsp:Transcript_8058/g.20152  ORF Transcript_8058/g.20152 Transcript_8058/m.20152 type:complete len:200 (+) Transcript_8058:1778-2377(+)